MDFCRKIIFEYRQMKHVIKGEIFDECRGKVGPINFDIDRFPVKHEMWKVNHYDAHDASQNFYLFHT